MALQSSFYTTDGTTRTFPSTKHIATKQHVAVYLKKVSDSTWELSNSDRYELVNNAVIFIEAPDIAIYSQIEVRVADTAGELENSPSDIALVASSIENVNITANNISSVNTTVNNISSINNVSSSIANVNTVAANIVDIQNAEENATQASNSAISASASATLASNSATSALNSLNEFKGIYHGALSTEPTVGVSEGDLYWNTSNNTLYVYSSLGTWMYSAKTIAMSKSESVHTISTLNETINTTYEVGFIDVFVNGTRLVNNSDYTATNGTSISVVASSYGWDIGDTVVVAKYNSSDIDVYNSIIAEYEVTGSNVTSIDFSGLDINSIGGSIEFELNLINATTNMPYIRCYVNNETNNISYKTQLLSASSTTILGSSIIEPRVGTIDAGAYRTLLATGTISIISEEMRFISSASRSTVGDVITNEIFTGISTSISVTNITQITFVSSIVGAIGIGSKITLRRKNV